MNENTNENPNAITISDLSESALELPKSQRYIIESLVKGLQKKFKKETLIHHYFSANPTLLNEGWVVLLDDSFVVLKITPGIFYKTTIENVIPYSNISSVDFDIKTVLHNPSGLYLGSLEIKYKKTFGTGKLKLRNIDENQVQNYVNVFKKLSETKG